MAHRSCVATPCVLAYFLPLCGLLVTAGALATTPGDSIKPGDNLVIDGIPALPASIATASAPYTEFRASRITAWHPTKREILILTRNGNANQIHRVAEPGAKPEPITDFKDPVTNASYPPRQADYFLFEKSTGGDEAFQISRLDLDSRSVTQISQPNLRASAPSWSTDGERIVYTTTTLDRHNSGRQARMDLHLVDPDRPDSGKVIASFEGGGWGGFRWSLDDKQLVFQEYKSANEAHLWILDLASGAKRRITPEPNGEPVRYADARFSADGRLVYATSDRGGEFRRLVKIDLASGKEELLTGHLNSDVDDFTIARKTNRAAFITNEDGVHVLRFMDMDTHKEVNRPPLVAGVISALRWHANGEELAFTHASARSAGDVFSWNWKTAQMTRWTNGAAAGVNVSEFAEPKLIKWKSFDGLAISGLLYDPPERFKGKRPVIISIHGGPEAQSRAGFIGRGNYFVNELGVALIFPNVRGSSGFGKTFLKLDNGKRREDAVKDIGALLEWIKQQPDLDPSRVLVMGGSYGGYMSLAVAARFNDRIAGSMSTVGISNFITFLNNTETYRRDLRRVEYGDERDPEMRAFLESISPLNQAGKIKRPLFVAQGKNDPRVPYTEAEQIVAAVKKRGTPVWFLMANDEGHGFAKKANADFLFYAQVKFIQDNLFKQVR